LLTYILVVSCAYLLAAHPIIPWLNYLFQLVGPRWLLIVEGLKLAKHLHLFNSVFFCKITELIRWVIQRWLRYNTGALLGLRWVLALLEWKVVRIGIRRILGFRWCNEEFWRGGLLRGTLHVNLDQLRLSLWHGGVFKQLLDLVCTLVQVCWSLQFLLSSYLSLEVLLTFCKLFLTKFKLTLQLFNGPAVLYHRLQHLQSLVECLNEGVPQLVCFTVLGHFGKLMLHSCLGHWFLAVGRRSIRKRLRALRRWILKV